jgi:hypothetical protein
VHLLPFRSFEVKVLRRTQRFPHQHFLGERCDVFSCALLLETNLSIRRVSFELGEIADNEHVLRSPERGAGEYKPSVGQDLGGTDGAVVRERVGGNIPGWKRWVSRGLVRGIRDREDEEFVARMIASQVKKVESWENCDTLTERVSPQEDGNIKPHSKFFHRSAPMLRERVANVFFFL